MCSAGWVGPELLNLKLQRIGLTGGIGSGKSTVAQLLVQCGAWLVDTDAIARSLTLPGGAALPRLAELFGEHIIGSDGALDRDRMRQLAFANPEAKRQLEGVLHPLIGQQAQARALEANGRVVVFDVPLLTESRHWRDRVQRVLVVDCSEATQRQRVLQRSAWREEDVQRVIAQQAPRPMRRAIADAVIHNDGISLDVLGHHVRALWQQWCAAPVEQ